MSAQIKKLYEAVLARRHDDPATSRTAKLLASGRAKMAQKLGEEAVEVVVDLVKGRREAVISESADLLYHLVVIWVDLGIEPGEVWAEMDRREAMLGIAEKLPKTPAPAGGPDLRRVRGSRAAGRPLSRAGRA
jgi:phosphoribosyl-ATP pyrophosphohydrolase